MFNVVRYPRTDLLAFQSCVPMQLYLLPVVQLLLECLTYIRTYSMHTLHSVQYMYQCDAMPFDALQRYQLVHSTYITLQYSTLLYRNRTLLISCMHTSTVRYR